MNRIFWVLCLAGVAVGCTSVTPDIDELVGHDDFKLESITRLRDLPLTTGESRFKAVFRITNRSNQNLLYLQHPYYRDWEVQKNAGELIHSTIQSKIAMPSADNVGIIKPGETKWFMLESMPYRDSDLGFSPRVRLLFRRWSLAEIHEERFGKKKPAGICFPDRWFYSSWR